MSGAPTSLTESSTARAGVVRILDISPHGFWVDLGNEKLYAAYVDFPWFANATLAQLEDVQRPSPDHLYWPALDVDLSVASLRDPAAFPLVANPTGPQR
ncbi:DUF2442 domain-containing protein [Duganella sp. BJB488]|uniref:DUF2442 domain-containing protein n=1 Tax=unclassified Duganella TaxID=2636909 RepID=UPI000E35321C|nr:MULTISPECIES: DUF2442 domain-containing protein [unclassified Duganella]RFP16659.1 DUF2442 domain-containing protein [Duganella sp. BJB489]RFP20915.1 DUF2442 domain-containing protein [Duganella sp. BJB488]RFP32021.1 DUF2442 domain-containing protein [Duganella sp. BJB480]